MNTHERRTHGEPQDIEVPPIELSAEKVQNIVFWSFNFSQGSISLQKDILEYLAIHHPEWRADLSATDIQNVAGQITDSMLHMVEHGKHKHMFPDLALSQAEQQVENFVGQVKTTTGSPLEGQAKRGRLAKLLEDITKDMLESDTRFFSGDSNSSEYRQQSKSSFVCTYALLGTKTALPEFDQLFADINTYIRNGLAHGTYPQDQQQLLEDIVAAHNTAHPDQVILLQK